MVFFCDELGTMPPFDILPLFSAGRSRRLTLVPIIQSIAQLEKNYGKEGAEILTDNCQDTIFGGFAPQSQTVEVLSKALGSRTVLSGSISRGKNEPYQMPERVARKVAYAGKRQLTQAIIRKKRGTTPSADQGRSLSNYNTAQEV